MRLCTSIVNKFFKKLLNIFLFLIFSLQIQFIINIKFKIIYYLEVIIFMNTLFVLLTSLMLSLPLQAESSRYIVKLKPQKENNALAQKVIKNPKKGKLIKEMKEGYVAELNDEEFHSLFIDPEVETIEKDQIFKLIKPVKMKAVDETSFVSGIDTIPPGVKRIKGVVCDTTNATVAIIDTGIDFHKDLNIISGKNFVNPSYMPIDDNGHGTHVAGTVAAKCDGEGVLGVAPGAKLVALKVLDANGSGWLSDILSAIDWVTDHADMIDVVNMSLGGYGTSDLYHQAIQRSVAKGVVYVVAAGNESMDIFGSSHDFWIGGNVLPAAYPEVMTISAMGDTDGVSGGSGPNTSFGERDDTFAFFSNHSFGQHHNNPVVSPGAAIDLAAPGVDILSTFPGNQFATMSGTSMASPHAAGAVARFIAKYGRDVNGDGVKNAQDVYQIRQAMIDSGQPQTLWNSSKNANDPDPNHESLLQVQ